MRHRPGDAKVETSRPPGWVSVPTVLAHGGDRRPSSGTGPPSLAYDPPRARITLAGACAAAVLGLSCPAPTAAAPYTDDALLTISVTTPLIGGTLTITVLNFETGELVDIEFTGFGSPLTTLRADENGTVTAPITLPAGLLGGQTLTAPPAATPARSPGPT